MRICCWFSELLGAAASAREPAVIDMAGYRILVSVSRARAELSS